MKTIGILGGIGPQATMALVERIHIHAQRRIPPSANAGYPPMIVHYCRFAPVLLDKSGNPLEPLEPDPRFLKAAEQLGTLSDFLLIGANAAHLLQADVERSSSCQVLSMIDVTLAEVQRKGWRYVGLVGLGRPTVYIDPFGDRGIEYHLVSEGLQTRLDPAILRVMEGTNTMQDPSIAAAALAELRGGNVDGIILGCTELPFLLPDEVDAADVIDPGDLLAEAAVVHAIDA